MWVHLPSSPSQLCAYMLCDPTIHDTFLRVKEVNLIELVHLFQEDESEDCVWTQSGIVWGEALPQAEEPFFTDHSSQYILWRQRKGSSVI